MRPFSCSTQYADWQVSNCALCIKFNSEDGTKSCELDQALAEALFGNGEVSDEVAKAIGAYEGNKEYLWICPSRVKIKRV